MEEIQKRVYSGKDNLDKTDMIRFNVREKGP